MTQTPNPTGIQRAVSDMFQHNTQFMDKCHADAVKLKHELKTAILNNTHPINAHVLRDLEALSIFIDHTSALSALARSTTITLNSTQRKENFPPQPNVAKPQPLSLDELRKSIYDDKSRTLSECVAYVELLTNDQLVSPQITVIGELLHTFLGVRDVQSNVGYMSQWSEPVDSDKSFNVAVPMSPQYGAPAYGNMLSFVGNRLIGQAHVGGLQHIVGEMMYRNPISENNIKHLMKTIKNVFTLYSDDFKMRSLTSPKWLGLYAYCGLCIQTPHHLTGGALTAKNCFSEFLFSLSTVKTPSTQPVCFNIVYELSDILDDLIPDRLFVVAIRNAAAKIGLVKDHQQSPSAGVLPPLSEHFTNGQQPYEAQPNTIGVFTSTPMFGRFA